MDKYLALIQGGVNLVISIVLVQKIGLMGVYIGTIVSGLIANVTKPVIIYKVILQQPVKKYFVDSLKYLAAVAVNFAVLSGIKTVVMPEVTVISFGVMFVIVCVVFNASFLALFGRTEEFGYLWGIVKGNDAYLYGEKVKAYLRRGAKPLPGFDVYPNPQVGYGALCVRDSLPG